MLTQERLKELLHYDPDTGVFTWVDTIGPNAKKGNSCGSLGTKGYLTIRLDGKLYRSHRLAWLYVTGNEPQNYIDHINRIKTDNRFCNLRDLTNSENLHNRIKPQKTNTSGHLGIDFHKASKKWRARVNVNKKEILIGFFETKELAIAAYKKAKKIHHPTCSLASDDN